MFNTGSSIRDLGGRECIFLEPPLPIKRVLYRCDNKFHIDGLKDLYGSDQPQLGLVLVTGSLTEFYLAGLGSGEDRYGSINEIASSRKLFSKSVDLPNNHCRGGQSQARIGRLRDEAIHNYITKLTEAAVTHFIDQETNCINIVALIIAGPGDKKKLVQERLDPRLKKVTQLVTAEIDHNKTITDRELQDIVDKCGSARNGIGRSDPLKEWEDAMQESKGVYGPKEVEKALKAGLLEKIFIVKRKINSKIEKKCQEFNCTIVSIKNGNDFGEILGITWYANALQD